MEFSVHDWLRAADFSKYEKNLLEHGYNTYESCVNLSQADLLAAGVDRSLVRGLVDRIKDLRAVVSEEAAIQELSAVSICSGSLSPCTVYMCKAGLHAHAACMLNE